MNTLGFHTLYLRPGAATMLLCILLNFGFVACSWGALWPMLTNFLAAVINLHRLARLYDL